MRGNKIAPLQHTCLTSLGTCAKGVQFYCPSHTYPAIPYCTIFSIFSTLWPLAWPFAMQISLLLFKIGGESCTLYTIAGFVFQLNFLQDLMLDMKMGSWLGIKICLVMLELDSWCTSFDTFFGTKISNVSNVLYNTSMYLHS